MTLWRRSVPDNPAGPAVGAGIAGLGLLAPLLSGAADNPVAQIFLYQVIGNLISPLLAPFAQELLNKTQSADQQVPLSPDQLAALVIRGYMTVDDAAKQAANSGMSPGHFKLLADGMGNAPGPIDLAVALRRGFIPEDSDDPTAVSFMGGIRQGDLKNKWATMVKQLATQQPSPPEIITALVEGQIDLETARDLFTKVGGDPAFFDLSYHTHGTTVSPLEAASAAYRGIIPWDGVGPDVVSFEQSVHESAYRNKWLPVFRSISQYITPPRTITAMLREGALTVAQATDMFKANGLTPELTAAYVSAASSQKLASHKELALGVIQTLYEDMAIDQATATDMLTSLGYDATESAFLLEISDLKRAQASINRALTSTHTLYVGHKITRNQASGEIDSLGVASQMRDELLSIWDGERAQKVALLTPTQIRSAMKKNLIDQQGALDRLIALGYGADDAAIFLQL